MVQKLSEMNTSSRILYPDRSLFRSEGIVQNFIDRQQLRKFIVLKPVLQGELKKDPLEDGMKLPTYGIELALTQGAYDCPLLD